MLANTRMRRPSRVAAGRVPLHFRGAARGQPLPAAGFERRNPIGIGRNPNRALLSIHGHNGSIGQCGDARTQSRDNGDSQGPRQNDAVCAGARRLQAQAQNHGGVEILHLGRRQIVRREDRRLAQNAGACCHLPGEPSQHARRHIRHVGRAGAQIGVFERGKTVREFSCFRLPGGLGADSILQHHARDCAEQFRVLEEERLRIENAGLIRANVSLGPFVERPGLFLRAVDGGRQALLFSLRIFDGPRSDFHGGGAQLDQRTDGDARGRRDAAGLGRERRFSQAPTLAATGFDEAHQRGQRLARFGALCADAQLVAFARAQAQDGVDATGRDVVERHPRSITAGQANKLRSGPCVEAETVGEGEQRLYVRLTDGSVCPTLMHKTLCLCGAGAFACQLPRQRVLRFLSDLRKTWRRRRPGWLPPRLPPPAEPRTIRPAIFSLRPITPARFRRSARRCRGP